MASFATGAAAGSCSQGLGLVETAAANYVRRQAAPYGGARHLPARRRPLGSREHPLAGRPSRAGAGPSLTKLRRRFNEAILVLGETQRQRWIASTLAGLAEVAISARRPPALATERLEAAPASAMLSRDDAIGVAEVESRLQELDKSPLRRG